MINMDMSNTEIVKRIDLILKEKNLKRQAIYDYAKIAYNTFPNWTKKDDTKIPAQVLYQIAKFLGVSMEYLLTGEEKDFYKKKYDTLIADIEKSIEAAKEI